MQVAQPISAQEEELAKALTNLLRDEVRNSGQASWRDLDVLLAGHRRFGGYTCAQAISVARHSAYRGNFRFELFFSQDAGCPDGYRYSIRLRPHLYANRHGR